ncbi:MAG: PrsW family intramembrane metalloprotease [Bacteroidetes bacterium]|nr:PrsW family intramembrane metalloprotease [Bacteroidota bacterium]MBS1931156.1 PrsW family intramembrane metalloprotease [Bacteroidota bacterium]
MEYIALGAAPGLAICLFIFYRDLYNKEPALNLIISFILGCLAILPAIFFENALSHVNDGTTSGIALFAYLVVGFSEEFSKFLGLRLYSYNQKAFNEPLDGIIYAVIVSMGFATVENIMYAIKFHDMKIVFMRMFLSVPAHATFGIIMGYFVGKAKFESKGSFGMALTGLIAAIFFHGTFDFFLFVSQKPGTDENSGNAMLAIGAIVSFIISLILCRKMILADQRISKRMFKDHTPPPPPNV